MEKSHRKLLGKEEFSKEELDQTLTDLHKENLLLQKYYHLDSIPVGDFSLYDHI